MNGEATATLPLRHETLNGLSYLRFRSTATSRDEAGFLVESVEVKVEDAYAPEVTAEQMAAQEKRYVEQIVPRWKS